MLIATNRGAENAISVMAINKTIHVSLRRSSVIKIVIENSRVTSTF